MDKLKIESVPGNAGIEMTINDQIDMRLLSADGWCADSVAFIKTLHKEATAYYTGNVDQ